MIQGDQACHISDHTFDPFDSGKPLMWSADKPVAMRLLKNGSMGIIVEGVAGIFHGASIDQERVFLKQRKGFIKCAIQAGVGEPAPPQIYCHASRSLQPLIPSLCVLD